MRLISVHSNRNLADEDSKLQSWPAQIEILDDMLVTMPQEEADKKKETNQNSCGGKNCYPSRLLVPSKHEYAGTEKCKGEAAYS